AALALVPHAAAQFAYERAASAAERLQVEASRRELVRAVALDPGFPLYRLRLALAQAEADRRTAAVTGRQAASDARGVPTLWLAAGLLAHSTEEDSGGEAFTRACELDAATGLAPFDLALGGRGATAPLAGHAVAADPRLLAAVAWEGWADALSRALESVRERPGIDPGWKEALFAAAPRDSDRQSLTVRLALAFDTDTDPLADVSPAVFRRRPWPFEWPLVQLRRASLARTAGLPAAPTLRSTEPTALAGWGCGWGTDGERRRSLAARRLRSR
ncbi:MAG TPA: hypothetical protein VGE98_08725, partial [Thermoanaerobaculia bacterium]